MKIIEAGSVPGDRTYQSRCRHCSTLFEFAAREAVLRNDQRDGDYYEVKCPLAGCGRPNYVSKAD